MMMKKIFIVSFSIFSIIGCHKEKIKTTITDNIEGLDLTVLQLDEKYNLRSIYFNDTLNGYASGYDGKVIRTRDGGLTWYELVTNTRGSLCDIDFIDNNIGFIVGLNKVCSESDCSSNGAIILKTADGGNTWKSIPLNLESEIKLNSVHFVNSTNGFAVGNSSILSTKDGGNTWVVKKIDSLKMFEIDFKDPQNGIIVCIGGQILSTKNGGDTWQLKSKLNTIGSVSISIEDKNTVYVSGANTIYKSNDFGETWNELKNPPFDNFDLNFIKQDFGFAVGRGGYSGGDFGDTYGSVYYTTNGGESWIGNADLKNISVLHQSSFPSDNLGYIVSFNKILKVRRK